MTTQTRTLIDELYERDGKAEIINGEIVPMSPSGKRPNKAGLRIASSLQDYEDETGSGYAVMDNCGFMVNLPNREFFSPDAAWVAGGAGDENDLDFVDGPPTFAVEVRSKNDYGKTAEREIAEKRQDYFRAGTAACWDVDLKSETPITLYLATTPNSPIAFRRGEDAHAEPVLPGWRFPVNRLFKRAKE